MTLVKQAPHSDVTYKIVGACMQVHNDLGPGHREEAYHNALAMRLEEAGLSFQDEENVAVCDDQERQIALYRPDFRVEHGVLLEIKAQTHNLTNDDMAQVIDYFAGTDCEVALLVNFGRPRLEWKRLFPPKKIADHRRKKWEQPGG